MEYTELTIKQVADECGVSKSTAVRKLKELGLPVITRGGKGTVYLGPEASSALAHALMKSRVPEVPSAQEISEVIGLGEQAEDLGRRDYEQVLLESLEDDDEAKDAIIEALRDQVDTLKAMNDSLTNQIDQLNRIIGTLKDSYETSISILTGQVDRLSDQLKMSQKEKDQLRDELALSRALEGFHFPWQRDRIMARYLLPSATPSPTADTDDDFEVVS